MHDQNSDIMPFSVISNFFNPSNRNSKPKYPFLRLSKILESWKNPQSQTKFNSAAFKTIQYYSLRIWGHFGRL